MNHTQFGVDPSTPGVGPGSIPVDNNVNDQAQFGSTNTNFGRVVSAHPGRVLQLGGKLTLLAGNGLMGRRGNRV